MTIRRTKQALTGKTLRWVVCIVLFDARREMTVAEIVEAVEARGFVVPGPRAGKSVSDALRWEVARGRAEFVRRGVYAPGFMQRSTAYSLRRRVEGLADAKSTVAPDTWPGGEIGEIDLDALDTSDSWTMSPAPAIAVEDL